jgi:membrane protein DedA with SNARE-associated domain
MPSIAHLIHAYGLLVVAGLIGLECVGIPFPGETVLIIASVDAGTKHDLNIASVILTAAAASIIGRMIGYVIGREFGYWVLLRYGGYLRITESRIKLGQYLFLRHGGKIILIAQFVPVLRSIAGLAGANRTMCSVTLPFVTAKLRRITGCADRREVRVKEHPEMLMCVKTLTSS